MHTLSLTFSLTLRPQNLYAFRGAFIHLARTSTLTDAEKELFSNREDDGGIKGQSKERYALVQYRWEQGKAVIWAMNEGAKALKKLANSGLFQKFTIEGDHMPLEVIKESEKSFGVIQARDTLQYTYLGFHFIPFNNEKDKAYHELGSFAEKVKLLEQILLNEIVLLKYVLQPTSDTAVEVELIDVIRKSTGHYKTKDKNGDYITLEPQSYFIKFRSNLEIPDGMSIGRHKANGYGVIRPLE